MAQRSVDSCPDPRLLPAPGITRQPLPSGVRLHTHLHTQLFLMFGSIAIWLCKYVLAHCDMLWLFRIDDALTCNPMDNIVFLVPRKHT